MIGIDLFSGAGGMSLGARWAGVDVCYGVEMDPYAAKTYLYNHKPSLGFLTGDIRDFAPIEIPNRKSPLVIFGGPPCQGFSTSNQKTRNTENTKNWLFLEFVRIVDSYKPEWIIFENVKGITETQGGMFVDMLISKFEKLGYTCSTLVLNAKDFGVPQSRSRFFLICSLLGHSVNPGALSKRKPISVDEAFLDLPVLENGASIDFLPYSSNEKNHYIRKMRKSLKECGNHLVTNNSRSVIERYAHIPCGGNWEDIPARLMANYKDRTRCHTGIYHRLTGNRPSVVIGNFRKNMLIHPSQDRGLSVREAARLQSFPDAFRFFGSIGFQQQQVGNAVPPLLAKTVFDLIRKCQ